MKLRSVLSLFVLGLLAACSGNDGKIEVEAGSSALTDKGGDSLFTVKLVEAREEGYALDAWHVKVKPEDKDAFDVVCTVSDANGNKKLDKGDTLSCTEPADNKLGPDLAGKEVEVELYAKIDGDDERIGDATWKPK